MCDSVTLDGENLNVDALYAIAQGCRVEIESAALSRMDSSNALILDAVRTGKLVYGVTTGLGPQVTTVLSEDLIKAFSLKTIRGRAHAVGKPLEKNLVRAAMAVRLNSLLTGASGASPAVAEHLCLCLNAGLTPRVGETASVGAADLLWGATMGLALVGEGAFMETDKASDAVMQDHNIPLLKPGPRDGLALASHSSFSTAIAAMGKYSAQTLWRNTQLAVALTLEGFRGNLSPVDADVLSTRHQPGQSESASDLLLMLEGSRLHDEGSARRLQDPLSIRNAVQVNGAVYASLESINTTLLAEINGASDNPVVLTDRKQILSGGGYLNPYLAVQLVGLNHALLQMAASSVARSARMMSTRFTDLPIGLNAGVSGSVGLGAVTKVVEALFAEIAQLATPPVVYPPAQADSVEDCITNTAISAKALQQIIDKLNIIVACEMIAAVHAIYLRDTRDITAPTLKPVIDVIRELSPALEDDRSLTIEIEKLSFKLSEDVFSSVRNAKQSVQA